MDQNQNQNTNVSAVSDGEGEPMASNFGVVVEPGNPEALSLDPGQSPPGYEEDEAKAREHTSVVVRLLKRADVVLVLLLVMGLVGVVVANVRHKSQNPVANNATQDYDTVKLPLTGFVANDQGVSIGASSVAINGSLKVNDGLVVAPSVQPNAPTAGQLYYDQNTNQLAYYNGTGYVQLTAQSQTPVVQSVGGVSGAITLGAGLATVGNQLVAVTTPGVSSLGGATGAISIGSGLKLTANGLQNAGVLSLAAGANITVTNDGNGNYTVINTGAGSGTVTSSGSSAGSIAMFDSAQNITDSLISQSGAQVTITGDLNVVTGGLSLGNALTVSNGGTGATSLAGNGVVVAHGTGSFTSVTTGSPGLCLMSTAGAPAWNACPGNSGVTALNGLSGVLTIANASGSGGTVTIDDATTAGAKGIASFNSTNFTASAGVINTIQDISTTAAPSFGRLTVSSGQATNGMLLVNNTNLSATGNLLDLQLGGSSKFSVQPGGNITTTGTVNGQTISSSASFTGTLGVTGNTTLSGTLNVNGGTIGATGNLAVTPSGSLTAGSSTQTLALQGNSSSTVAISNGGNTTTVSFQAPGANVTYRVPTAAAGSYDICTTAGNCVGSGGGVTTSGGTTNRLSKFTGAQSVGDSSISDNGTLVSTTANIAIQGGAATVGVANSQTGTLTLAYGAANFSGALTVGTLTASRTYTLPDADGTVCLSSGNCLGGGGGGANTALSNLSSVAINTSLLPGSTSIDLGSASAPFRNLFIAGSSASPNTNNFQITGTATGARTITLPDSSGTVCLNNSTNCGFLTGTGTAFVQNGNTFGGTGVLGTTDANALQLITGNVARLTLGASGGATFANDVAINGSTLSSASALNITPGGTLTVGATNQALTLQGSASTTVSATGGGFTTTVGFTGSPIGAVTYNFDRTATPGTYNICTTSGNCSGSGGGVTTPGGTNNRIAKFTGSQTLGDSSLSDNGTLVSTTGNLTVQGGTATIGVANSQTGILSLAWGSANFSGSLTQGTLTANRSYTLPDASGTVCLSSGNCLGGGGGGANTALSNLTSVAINTSLLPGGTTVDLGSSTAPFRNLYLAGSSASPASNNFTITGTATGARTITLPDATGTVCLNNSVSCGFATGSGSAFVQSGNTFGATAVLGANDNFGLNLRTNGNTALALDTSGNGTLTGNLTINGTTLSSAGALNITPGSTLTVGATAQTLTLQGNASSTLAVTGGGFTTTVGFTGSPTGAVTYNFDRTVAAGTYTICSTIGNCAGSGSGVTTAGGTSGTIAVFTGTQAIGNSLLSQSGGTVAVNGNLNLTSGNNYQINGSQISSANLSNDANLAKLSASQTFSGATLSFQNSGSNSANAFNIQNTGGNSLFTANTTAGTIILGTSGSLDGKLVFSNVSNSNTTTILPGTPTANRTVTLPDVSGVVCLDSGNCAGAGATLQTGYNFSTGGTTPKIKLNSTLNGVDIQDADTTIGVDLLDVRGSNGSGLGAVLFGVGNTGQITMKNSSNSSTALSVLTQGGTRVLTVNTSAGSVSLGQGGTLAGTLVLNNATNSNTGSVITSALGQNTVYTLPDPAAGTATICLSSGNCLGGGGGGANTALSNLSGVAINTTLLPVSAGTVDLGSGTLPFGKLYIAGTSSTPASNNFQITGVATATRTITLPDASGTVCLNNASACGFASGSGNAFVNNGNTFGATAVLGTNDNNNLVLRTNSNPVATFSAANGSLQLQNASDSAAAFKIVNNANSETVLTVDTAARSGSGGNLVKIGNSTGTDTALTILQLDSATAAPTSNLAALNGGLFYNSTTNKVSLVENGQVKIICNTTDLGCGTGTVTLQSSYTNSTGGTTPEILLDSTRNGLDIQDANSTIGASTALLAVRGSATATTLGSAYLQVVGDGRVGVGSIASGVQLNVAGGSGITALKVTGGTNTGTSAGGDGIQATGGTGGNTTSGGVTSGFGGANSLTGGTGGNATGSNSYGGWGGATTLTSGNGGTSSLYHGGDGGAVTITGGNGGASTASVNSYAGNGGSIVLQGGNGAESGGAATGGTAGNITLTAGTAGFNQNGGNITLNTGGSSFGGNFGNISLAANSGTITASSTNATGFVIQNGGGTEVLFTANSNTRTSGVAGNTLKVGNSTGTDTALTVLQLDSATANPTTNLASMNGGLFYNSTTNKVSLVENGQIKVICNTTDLGCGTGTVTLQNAYTNSTGGTTSEIILDSTRNGLDIQDRSTSNGGTLAANLLTVRATAATDATAGAILMSVGNTGATLLKNSSDQNNAFQIQNASSVALLSVSTLAGTGSSVQLYAPSAGSSTTTEGIWIRAPKSAVTALFGNNDSVSSYTVNESSANLRFNGSGVAWGDMGYYPQGGGDGNYGQFRFSTTGSSINTTPNAKVGVGDMYVGGKLGIGTTSPVTQLHVAGSVPSGAAQALSLSIDLPYDIEVRGKYLYAAVSSKLRIFDITRPTSMAAIGSVATGSGVATLAVSGHYAYVSVNSGSMYVVDISNPASPSVVSTTTVSSLTALTVQGRYLYASTSDSSNNIKVYDLANPASPTLVASLAQASAPSFLVADGRYLYTTTAASGTLVVIDISNPASPTNVSTSLALGASYMVRAVQGRYAYAVSGSNMKVVDISNPTSPTTSSTTATGTGSYDVAVQGRYAYIALDSSGNGIQVMDISNPTSPSSVGTVSAGGAVRSVFPNGRYVYAANYGNTTLDSYDMGGAYIQQLEAGGIEASTISTNGRLSVGGDGYIQGSLNVGNGATIGGNTTVNGAASFQAAADSTNAFQVKNAAGMLQLNLNTATSYNEVTNGDMEGNSTAGWTARGTADQLQIATTPVKFGRYSLHLRTLSASGNGMQYGVALKASTTYSLSMWARRDTSSAGSFSIGRAENGSDTDCLSNQTLNTTFTQFTCTFTTGSTVGSTSNVYIKQTDTSSDEIYVDGVTLTQGSTYINYQTPSSGLEVASYYNNVSLNGNTANPELQPWQLSAVQITTNGSTVVNRSRAASVAYNGYMYVLGGGTNVDGNSVASSGNALYSKINSDGTLGAFASTTNLGTAVSAAGAVVINGYMYVIGGKTADAESTGITTVQYARIASDGTLGAWSTTTVALPAARSSIGVATFNSYVYVTGGQDALGGGGTNTVYYAKVNADGNITSWSSGTLPTAPSSHGTFVNNGYLYTLGSNQYNQAYYNYSKLAANGTPGTWTSVANVPTGGIGDAGFTTMNGYAYTIGGWNGSALINTVYYAPFNPDGTFGTWTQAVNSLPRNTENNNAVVYNGYVYSIGGDVSGGTVTPSIYYASGPRVRVAGSLDLVGPSATNLAETDGGGSLTAGDTNIVGSLQVQGNAAFKQSVSVGAGLSVGGEINAGSFSGAGLSDCDSTNSKLLWDASSKQFSCGTDKPNVMLKKASDQTVTSSATLQNDNTFTFSAGANETWTFEIEAVVKSDVTPDFKFALAAPTGSTCDMTVNNLYESNQGLVNTCGDGGAQAIPHSDNAEHPYIIWGTVTTSSTSGSVTFRWAQNTSNASSTIVRANGLMYAYKITGADLGEAYYTKDNTIGPGDIVRVDDSLKAGVRKTTGTYDSGALGIVSTSPGYILGDNYGGATDGRPVLLALSGRVPAKVSLENGPIKAGDYLTTSSIPGVAMKATQPGQMIGKALEDFNSSNPDSLGTVLTFANLTWANPETGATANNDVQGSTMSTVNMNVAGLATTQNLTVADTATVKNLVVGTMATVKELNVTGNATFAGDINLSGVGQSRNAITKKFKASKPIAIGSVVVADPDNDGQVTTTTTPNDTRVLGIALTAAQQAGDEITVAIGGSVQVRTVTGATIQGGDLLTSSGEEGVAEKSSAPTPGSLLGKALGKPTDDMTWLLITLN